MDEVPCPDCGARAADTGALIACPACGIQFLGGRRQEATLLARGAAGGPSPLAQVPLSPEFVRRWQLGKVLGVGGMGTVYRAHDSQLGIPVAVKFMHRQDVPEMMDRFVREGELSLSIRHPRVVRVYAVGETSGHPYIVAELVAGGSLRERMQRQGRLPIAEAIRIGSGLLAGLEACHQRGVVHRDVKPENVMLTVEGEAKLTDLGIAKDHAAQEQLTQTGAILGTPRYMPPEQVRGEPVRAASDLYSAGVVLYEMLAGQPPFVDEQLYVLMRRIETMEPPPLEKRCPGLPPAVVRVIHQALAKVPEGRPASAAEFRAALRRR